APKFRQRPVTVQAELDATVTLTCDVDGNPVPEIMWIHEDKDRVVGSLPNLTFKVEAERAGRYYCRASVPGYPEIGAEAAVLVKGPPKVLSPHTQWGHVGDNARVECIVASVPRPDKIIWSYNGHEISNYDPDFSILDDPLPDGLKSTLIVRESQQHHYGLYNCTAGNAYGSVTAHIHLRAQKSYPLLIILTGVIGGVVVIIAITMVVILCQRRVKKPPVDNHEAEKQCRESDRSSNISDMKLELRTGSSVSRPGSETGSERGVGGVPLAGPVHLPMALNGGDHVYRYSTEYPEPSFPPKTLTKDGTNNNGYVPYVDYSRDYTPPPSLSLLTPLDAHAAHLGLPAAHATLSSPLACVDPRYSAAYGNPYLRTSSASLLPPHTSPAPSASPSTASTGPIGGLGASPGPPNGPPPPPPYSTAVRGLNGAAPQVARLPNSPTSQYIVPSSQMATIKRGTLATHV
ncbi:irregular chiasm C-roughest protein-like, partial [Frankliniella occidentalis]|uniref:Irregular chiasm C-roughest protein-like n=1 Tax=Frankliniella occidentalis TaxID=133901 RepID=A0A9C6XUY5_FRAOC